MTQYDPNDLKRRQITLSQLGLGGYSVQNTPSDQWEQTIGGGGRQKPPPGGWPSILQPQGPPKDIFGIQGMGEQIGGFGETLGGYGEQMGGFGEQLGGFGEQLGGFKGQFENIDSRLQNMEQGISGLTDKLGVQQQPQNPFQMYGGYNPYGSGYGGYSFFQDGGEVEKPGIMDRIKGFFQQRKESQPRMEGGDNPEYMKIFNFLWEKGFSEPQIQAIMSGEVNQEDIVPERMQMDENMNFSVPQEPFRGARGVIVDVLESLRPRMAGGGTIMDYTRGGHAVGPGTGTSDSIPAFLSDGEFVMTNKAVKGIGGGSREQGAQKLYSMMKKAEASA